MKLSELKSRSQSATESLRCQTDTMDIVDLSDIEATNEHLAAGSESVFASLGYAADAWKAYIQFNLCRALPNVAGPASTTGNYLGFTPRVLERNHSSLLHQQINLDHRMKAYAPDSIPRDRIVGCCVATSFPKPPMGKRQWEGLSETVEESPEITGMAVIFRLAEGVNRFLGDHLSGKRRRAVSIEVSAELEQLGIFVPSTREVFSLFDAPEELLQAIEPGDNGLILGKASTGEQLAWAYGGNDGVVEFRGTGIVEYPADRTARIQSVMASLDTSELCSLPADQVPELLIGRRGKLTCAESGAQAEVLSVHTSGRHGPSEWKKQASPCDPVLELRTDSGAKCWWHLSKIDLS